MTMCVLNNHNNYPPNKKVNKLKKCKFPFFFVVQKTRMSAYPGVFPINYGEKKKVSLLCC